MSAALQPNASLGFHDLPTGKSDREGNQQVENVHAILRGPMVAVRAGYTEVRLTPHQARAFAEWLTALADAAESVPLTPTFNNEIRLVRED